MSQIWVGQEKSCFTQNLSFKWVISLQHQYILQQNWPEFPAKRLSLLLFIWRPDHPELKSTGSLPSNQWNSLRAAAHNHQPAWPWWELRGSKLTPGVMKEPFRLPRQPRCFLLCSHPTCHKQLSQVNTQCKSLQQIFRRWPRLYQQEGGHTFQQTPHDSSHPCCPLFAIWSGWRRGIAYTVLYYNKR